jgi:hypothetical protein
MGPDPDHIHVRLAGFCYEILSTPQYATNALFMQYYAEIIHQRNAYPINRISAAIFSQTTTQHTVIPVNNCS